MRFLLRWTIRILAIYGLLVLLSQPAHSATIKATITTIHKMPAQPKPLGLDVLEAYLKAADGGTAVRISCDAPGVPSPLDGYTLAEGLDGQVFRVDPYDESTPIRNIVHVSVDECWAAQTSNRHRDPNPSSLYSFRGQRYDGSSGPALEVLLHESMHVALQSTDEARVDCAAVGNAWQLVKLFRLPGWEAKMLLVAFAWRHHALPPEYHLHPDC